MMKWWIRMYWTDFLFIIKDTQPSFYVSSHVLQRQLRSNLMKKAWTFLNRVLRNIGIKTLVMYGSFPLEKCKIFLLIIILVFLLLLQLFHHLLAYLSNHFWCKTTWFILLILAFLAFLWIFILMIDWRLA
jgi:hypothetical protein